MAVVVVGADIVVVAAFVMFVVGLFVDLLPLKSLKLLGPAENPQSLRSRSKLSNV